MSGMTHTEIVDNLNNLEKERNLALQYARRIADALKEHSLEPDWLIHDGSIVFSWCPQEFNHGHIAEIEIDGVVTATTYIKDHSTKRKFWWISDFLAADYEPGWTGPISDDALVLTLAETIECIRHHIWANHNL